MHASKEDLASISRLKHRRDFLLAAREGRSWTAKGLVLQCRSNESLGKRAGFTISRRVDKRAVVRNRVKRRLRAVAADILPGRAADDTDYVLIGRAGTIDRPYAQLCKDLTWCLEKLDLLEN